MGRKSKHSAEEKLLILKRASQIGITKASAKYQVDRKNIRRWQLLYQYQGLSGLQSAHMNQSYSKQFKISLVEQYQRSKESLTVFAIKHGLRDKTQLIHWITQYNGFNLKAYLPRKRDSKMGGRKTSFDERLTIIEDLIKHNVNYNWAAEKYQVSYQQVYGWYQKYRKSGNNPESLRDRRGQAKPQSEWTEADRLRAENRLLKAKLQSQEMEVAFAKKLIEIHNQGVNKNSKRSKR